MQDEDFNTGYGSLGGLGTEHHDSVKTAVTNEGVVNQLQCDKCGRRLVITIPWTELIFMSEKRLPPNNSWKHDGYHGVFLPNAHCPHCQDSVRLGMTPQECQKHIRAGIDAGRVAERDVAVYVAQVRGQR